AGSLLRSGAWVPYCPTVNASSKVRDQGKRGSPVNRRDLRSAHMIGWAVVTVAALALATGCTGTSTSAKRPKVVQTSLTITPSNGARQVKPDAGIAVDAHGGQLNRGVGSTSGHAVAGEVSSGGGVW